MTEPLPDWLQEHLRVLDLTPEQKKDAAWLFERKNSKTGAVFKMWIVRHWALELLAAKHSIRTEMTNWTASNDHSACAICVRGWFDIKDRPESEWATGEASKANTKQSYPFAMAEKRAKDRVILKLLGLHGHVYSEEEAEDFKRANIND